MTNPLTDTPNRPTSVRYRVLTWLSLAAVFWGGVVFIGLIVPFGLLFISGGAPGFFPFVAAVATLAGLLLYEDLWLQAGQSVPLS